MQDTSLGRSVIINPDMYNRIIIIKSYRAMAMFTYTSSIIIILPSSAKHVLDLWIYALACTKAYHENSA